MKSTYRIFSRLFVIALIIKIFDVIKNLVIASVLGVSVNADIYTAMITIPDSLIVILGLDTIKGVVNSEYAHFSEIGRRSQMWESFNNLFNILFWISLVVVSAIILFSSSLIGILLPGFEGLKKEKAVEISYIIFPILFLKVFIGYFNSVYNANKKFYLPVIAPVVIGVALLISLLLPYYNNDVIFNLSFANLAGNIFLFAIMTAGLIKLGAFFKLKKIVLDDITLKVLKGSLSILILVICNQLYLFSKNYFASYFGDGAIAALHYSGSISNVIVSLIFATFFTVLISNLSSLFSSDKSGEARDLFYKTVTVLFFGILPVVVFFIIFANELLTVIYLRGSFDITGIEMTLKPFLWDALSLITFIFYILPTALFLAKKEYLLLTKIGSMVYLSGIFINYFLSNWLGFYAISTATFITTGIYAVFLFIYSKKIIRFSSEFLLNIFLILICGIILFAVLYILKLYVFNDFLQRNFTDNLLILLANLFILFAVYYATTSLFKVNYVGEFLRNLKKDF